MRDISPELLELLEQSRPKVNKYIKTIQTNSLPTIDLIEKQILSLQQQLVKEGKVTEQTLQVLENYQKLGIFDNKITGVKDVGKLQEEFVKAIQKLEVTKSERETIKKDIGQTKYLSSKDKKQISELLDTLLPELEVTITNSLAKSLNTENKVLTKILSSLEHDIKENEQLSIFAKKELLGQMDSIISKYQEDGGLSESVIAELTDYISKLEKNGIKISEKDVIDDKLIKQAITKNVVLKQMDSVISEVKKEYGGDIEKDENYQKLVTGKISFAEFLEEMKKSGKSTEKLYEGMEDIFSEIKILVNEIDSFLAETTDLSASDREFVKNLYQEFKEEKVSKDQFYKILGTKLNLDSSTTDKLLKYLKKVEQSVESNHLDNASKILEEKRFDLLDKLDVTLDNLGEEIKTKDSSHILGKVISNSNSVEELGENMVTSVLDSIFGEGTLIDKVFDKFGDKYGGKIASKLSGVFSSLFNKIKIPKLGGAVSNVARMGASALGTIGRGAMGAVGFLATNPVGWAILGATAVAGTGYYLYNKKYGKDKEIIEQLEKQGIVEYSFFGDSEVKDWGRLLKMADDKTMESLVHFDDWDNKTAKMLKVLYKLPLEDRMALAREFDAGNAEVVDGKLKLTKEGVADLVTSIKNKKDLKVLVPVLDDKTKKYMSQHTKQLGLKEEDIKPKKPPKKPLAKKVKDMAKLMVDTVTPVSAIKGLQSLFGGDKYQIVERLEDMGALHHYIIGDSEILDWGIIQKLSPKEIKQLIDFDDWDEKTKKKLEALYKEKTKKGKGNISSVSINEETKNKIIKLKNAGYTNAHISKYLGVPEEEVQKAVNSKVTTNFTDKVISQETKDQKEKDKATNQNVTVVNQSVINGGIQRETIDTSTMVVSHSLGGV